MKFEYVFMGYIIIVIGRLYFSVMQDEVQKWKELSGRKKAKRNTVSILSCHP